MLVLATDRNKGVQDDTRRDIAKVPGQQQRRVANNNRRDNNTSKRKLKKNNIIKEEAPPDRQPSQKSIASTTATSCSERQQSDSPSQEEDPSARARNVVRRKQSTVTVSSMPSLVSFENNDDVVDGTNRCEGAGDHDMPIKDDSSTNKKGRRKIKRVVKRHDSDLSQDSTINDSVGSLGNMKELARKKRRDKAQANKVATNGESRSEEDKKLSKSKNDDILKKPKSATVRQKSSDAIPRSSSRSLTSSKQERSRKPEKQLSISSSSRRKSHSPKPEQQLSVSSLSFRNNSKSPRKDTIPRKSKSDRHLMSGSDHQLQRETSSLSPRTPLPVGERRIRKGSKKELAMDTTNPEKMELKGSPSKKSSKARRHLSDHGIGAEISPSFSPRRSKSMVASEQSDAYGGCSPPRKSRSMVDDHTNSIDDPEFSLDSILGSQPSPKLPVGASSIQSEPCVRRMPKGGSAIRILRKPKLPKKPKSERLLDCREDARVSDVTEVARKKSDEKEGTERGYVGVSAVSKLRSSSSGDMHEKTRPRMPTKVSSDRFVGMRAPANDLPPQVGNRQVSLHQRTIETESLKGFTRWGKLLERKENSGTLSHSPNRGRRRNNKDKEGDVTEIDKSERIQNEKPKKKKDNASKSSNRKLAEESDLGSAKKSTLDVASSDNWGGASFSSSNKDASTKKMDVSKVLPANTQTEAAWNTDTDNSDSETSADMPKKSRWTTAQTENDFIQAAKRKLTVDELLAGSQESFHVENPQIDVGGVMEELSPVTHFDDKFEKPKSKVKRGKRPTAPKL